MPDQPKGQMVNLPVVHFGPQFSLNLNCLAAVQFPDEDGPNAEHVLVFLIGGYEPIELIGPTAALFTLWFNETSGRGALVNRIVRP